MTTNQKSVGLAAGVVIATLALIGDPDPGQPPRSWIRGGSPAGRSG